MDSRWISIPLIALLFSTRAFADSSDFTKYSIYKSDVYAQTSAAAPTQISTPYGVTANVWSVSLGSVSNPTFTPPASGSIAMGPDPLSGHWTVSSSYYTTQAAMDAVYTSGVYSFSIPTTTAPTTTFTPSITLSGDLYSSDVAQLTGGGVWSGGVLLIDPSIINTFTWTAFTDYQGVDSNVEFVIFGSSYDQILNATDTSIDLNAGILAPNQSYFLGIAFKNFSQVDNVTIPGVSGTAFYSVSTLIPLQTIPEPSTWAMLFIASLLLLLSTVRRRALIYAHVRTKMNL